MNTPNILSNTPKIEYLHTLYIYIIYFCSKYKPIQCFLSVRYRPRWGRGNIEGGGWGGGGGVVAPEPNKSDAPEPNKSDAPEPNKSDMFCVSACVCVCVLFIY